MTSDTLKLDTAAPQGAPAGADRRGVRHDTCIALGLALAIIGVYAQTAHFEFLDYDDDSYIVQDTTVRGGLTRAGVIAAFTQPHVATWHPLTTLSHMLDCSLFGLWAGGHHLVNVGLHTLNTLLLFAVLTAMTGARWRSAFVAAIFGLHPLHVESVAWVAERKDVLSTCFLFLTLASYRYYTQLPHWRRYALVVAMYALAALSKPMVVTLPVVLVLLDVWPLQRLSRHRAPGGQPQSAHRPHSLRSLVWEKLPLFAVAGLLSWVTMRVQGAAGAMIPLDVLPMRTRLANLPMSYLRYIGKALWPTDLAIAYPYELHWPPWQVAGASVLLLVVTAAILRLGPRRGYARTGWLWYGITLLPVIGIVQVGPQSIADRYTYVPLIGLCMLVTWGVCDLAARWRHGPGAVGFAALVIVAACLLVTWRQVGFWRNSYTVFEHALAVTTDNAVAHAYLGKALLADGHPQEAWTHFNETLRLEPFPAKAPPPRR